jgi:hypothetical protein
MKSSMIMSLVSAVAAFTGVGAVIIPQPQDVWVPKILTPTIGTVWTRGTVRALSSDEMIDRAYAHNFPQQQNVTWDTTTAPALISNQFSVVLRDANRKEIDII